MIASGTLHHDTWSHDPTRGTDLPPAERWRMGAWLASHGIDPAWAHRPRVVANNRTAVVAVDVEIPLPDGTVVYTTRHVDMHTPPPVPWTA